MSRFFPFVVACLAISSTLLHTAGAQSASGLAFVQAESPSHVIHTMTPPPLPMTQAPRVVGATKLSKVQPPAPATSSDRVSVTLRTAEESYAADANWLGDVKRFMKYSQDLREWTQLKDSTRLKLQRKKQIEAGDKFLSPYKYLPTPSEIEAEIGPPPVAVPMPKALDLGLVLDIKNISDEPVSVNVGLYSDMATVLTTICGPGAVKYHSPPRITTMEIRSGYTITLAPGKTKSVRMNMTDGQRGFGGPWFFTESGDYEIVMTVHTTVDGDRVSLETNRVPFKILSIP